MGGRVMGEGFGTMQHCEQRVQSLTQSDTHTHTHTHTHTPSQPDTHTNGYIDVTKQIQHTGSSQQQQSDVHTLTDSLKCTHGLITQKGANKQCVHEQPEPHTIKHRGNYSN